MASFTYRCDPDMAARIKALKNDSGWSFQKLTDEYYKTLFWKYRTESPYFKDLTIPKKTDRVVSDLMAIPSLKNYFFHRA